MFEEKYRVSYLVLKSDRIFSFNTCSNSKITQEMIHRRFLETVINDILVTTQANPKVDGTFGIYYSHRGFPQICCVFYE